MGKELYPLGALCKTKEEADPRDYQSEYVLGIPTEEELNNLPRKIDLIGIMEETRNQGSVGSCTAMGICHTMLSMNILDHKRNDMFIDYKYQRTHNQGKEWITNSGGDYLENAAKTLRNNGVKGTIGGKDFVFEIDGYAVEERGNDFEKMLKIAMWHMSNGRPIYWAMYGNSKTRQECSAGEIKTVWSLRDGGTGGHAIEWGGIDFDRRKVKFANSWSWNSKNNKNRLSISSFEIDFDVFEQLLNNNVFNRRRWVLWDKKDIKEESLFIDIAGLDENSESYKAIKWAKEKGIIKGVPTNLGNRLEPNRPITRLEMLLVLRRFLGDK